MDDFAPLLRYLDRSAVRMGAIARDLEGRELLACDVETAYPAASVVKVPLVMALHAEAAAGRLSLDERVPVGAPVDGSGVLRHLRDLREVSLRDLARLTVIVSDNTATNRLIERVGMETVNGYLDSWGCRESRLRRAMYDFEAARRGRDNVMTPRDTARLFGMLVRGELVDRATSDALLAVFAGNQDESRLARYLPTGTDVAHKSGYIPGVRNDAGVIRVERAVIVAGFCRDLAEEARGDIALGVLGWCAYRAAGGRAGAPAPMLEADI
jgi:beta-lactamase class A